MKDLQLAGGDLVPSGRGFATVDGAAYLRQRIAMALAESYGSDPYHPLWGSALPSYLGQAITSGSPALVSSEAARVLQQLVDAQQQVMTNTVLTGNRSQFSAADLIASVDSVDAAVSPVSPDIIQVTVALTTQAGQPIQITRTVTSA